MLPNILVASSVPRGHIFHTQITPPRPLSVPVGQRKAGYKSLDGTLNMSSSTKTLGTTASGTSAATLDLGRDHNSWSNSPRMLPSRGHAASDFVYKSWHSTYKSSCRSRTEWLEKRDAQLKGEIRNIKVLGVIGDPRVHEELKIRNHQSVEVPIPDLPKKSVEYLIIAYQGQGRLKTFIEHGSSMELEEVGQWEVLNEKTGKNVCIYGAPSEDVYKKLKKKYVDSHNLHFRFATYRRPRLPCNIMVMGESEPDGVTLIKKPGREAVTKSRVSSSGHVTNDNSFLVAF